MALPTSLPDHCSSPLSPAGWRNWTSPHGRLLSRSPDYCSKSTKSKNGATTVATAVDAHAIITKSCYVRYRDLLTRYVFGANLGASGQTVGRERPGRCLPETAGTGYNALPLLSHSQRRRAKRGSIMLCEVWEHLAVIRAFPIYRQHVPGPLQRKDGKDKQVAEEWNVCMCVCVCIGVPQPGMFTHARDRARFDRLAGIMWGSRTGKSYARFEWKLQSMTLDDCWRSIRGIMCDFAIDA